MTAPINTRDENRFMTILLAVGHAPGGTTQHEKRPVGVRPPAQAGMPATQTAGKKPAPTPSGNTRTFERSNDSLGSDHDRVAHHDR